MNRLRTAILVSAALALAPLVWGGASLGIVAAGAVPYVVLLACALRRTAAPQRMRGVVVGLVCVFGLGVAIAAVSAWGDLFAVTLLPCAYVQQLLIAAVVAIHAAVTTSGPET